MRPDLSFTVTAVMECAPARRGPWRLTTWRLVGFVAAPGDADGARGRRLCVHREGDTQQWLWTGLTVPLYRDCAESYWYNLVGHRPSLFLICRESADGLVPTVVSANYDDAGAHMEADDQVFSAPLPPALHVELEAFVMTHYRPQTPQRRKRTNWTEAGSDGWKPSPRLGRR